MKVIISILLCILIFAFICCEQYPSPESEIKAELKKVKIENLKGIPSEYGSCIGITTHSLYDGWAQLWFEDEQKTIRMVRINFHSDRIHENLLVVPRY